MPLATHGQKTPACNDFDHHDYQRTSHMHSNRTTTTLPILLLLAATATAVAAAHAAETDASAPAAASPAEAIAGGKLLLELRPRYERVEQSNKPLDADAFTLRTRLGWKTLPWNGFSVTVEVLDVTRAFGDAFNPNPAVANSHYPTVADPDNTEADRLFVEYTGLAGTSIKVGRQVLALHNLRFLGDVNFRQTAQSFEAASVQTSPIAGLDVYGAYLWRQITTTGAEKTMRTPLLDLAYAWQPGQSVGAYGFFQDQANTGQATGYSNNSNRIEGVRADGAWPLGGGWKFDYLAEFARQSRYANGNAAVDASYTHYAAGGGCAAVDVQLQQERLGSNGGRYGFQTPLATLHIFQGWADQFLVTPKQGLIDRYLTGGGTVASDWRWYGEYHHYASDAAAIDFGRELDLSLAYTFRKGLVGRLEYADYRTGDPTSVTGKPDVKKTWITLLYTY
jgi:Alginate export